MRRTRRAIIGSIGVRGDSRKMGLVRAMDLGLKLVIDDGYEHVDTGPVLIDNAVVVKMVHRIGQRYGYPVSRTTYYTLQYDF